MGKRQGGESKWLRQGGDPNWVAPDPVFAHNHGDSSTSGSKGSKADKGVIERFSKAILKLPSLTLTFQTLILILNLSSIREILKRDSRSSKFSPSVSGYIKGSFSVVN
ncbi:hypothetical protein P8452_16860 [Trifolium repens]|nr:hypothetical protein P8452_16860 [Trifolium repens]